MGPDASTLPAISPSLVLSTDSHLACTRQSDCGAREGSDVPFAV